VRRTIKLAVTFAVVGLALAFTAGMAYAGTFPGANGKIAFHTNRDGNEEIYSMDPNGSNQTNLTNNPAYDVSASWSPDGSKIAFVSDRDGNYEIYTMNANGSGQTRITTNTVNDVQPSWSADGSKIAFTSDRSGDFEIWSVDANGSNPVRLTNSAGVDGLPNWSPDGSKIAFQSARDGNNEIYVMNANGSSPTRMTNTSASEDTPTWAPDGSKIAFRRYIASGPQSYVCSINAGGGGEICSSNFNIAEPSWAPDNTLIAVSAIDAFPGGQWDIWTGTTTGTSVAQLTTNPANDQGPAWQPLQRSYARPRGATPLRVSLVPAYKQCTAPNTKHSGTLSTASCNPASAESSYLTLGTPDFNGQPAKGIGSVLIKVVCNGGAPGENPPCSTTPGDQLDGRITVSQSDVRCQGVSAGCAAALGDYSGSLLAEIPNVRITDRNSVGPGGGATVQDIPVRFNVPCTPTGDTTVGSTCGTTTTIDGVLGGTDVVSEVKLGIWHLPDVRIYDGGADGNGTTQAGNTLFVWSGVFFP
jgi:Tol biopolymer transport system component